MFDSKNETQQPENKSCEGTLNDWVFTTKLEILGAWSVSSNTFRVLINRVIKGHV